MENNRNTYLAIALSIIIIVAWQFLYVSPKMEAERQAAEAQRRQIEQSQATTPQAGTQSDAANQTAAAAGN